MPKTNQIKKMVNGEIADADDVNQALENAGNEGGGIPYDDTTAQRASDGQTSFGSVAFPWGHSHFNKDANFVEVDVAGPTANASVAFTDLRRFIKQKDTPASYSGQAGKALLVNSTEDAVEFDNFSAIEVFTADGTFNVPLGITDVYIMALGGGAGGGGASGGAGAKAAGGGGGGCWITTYATVNAGAALTIQVGVGGAGGSAGNDGVDGEDTVFDVGGQDITAVGGDKGGGQSTSGSALGGAGGTVSGSRDAVDNVGGSEIPEFEAGGDGADGSHSSGAGGGGSVLGAGANGGGNNNAGVDATGNGAGGSGARTDGSARAGGAGSDGIMIIIY